VLLVDDEPGVRTLQRMILMTRGHTIWEARNGCEAIDLVREHGCEIGVVLLDLAMPEMNGAEVLRRIHALRPELRILVVSGYRESDALRELAGQRVEGFLQKPFSPGELLERVDAVVRPGLHLVAGQPRGPKASTAG
jgi:two-component system cell cycle sensor histidine kinase/response regulator CckA